MSAGYKQQCLNDGASAMWSFDSDTFDRTNYSPLTDIVIDDATGESNGRILTDYPALNHIYMGNSSLVEMEQSQQYSCQFGRNDGPFAITPQFPRPMVTVDHNDNLNFQANRGSFSVEFVMRKSYEYGFAKLRDMYSWWYFYKYSPVIRKKGVFSIYTCQESYNAANNRIEFRGPLGTCTCYRDTVNFVDTTVHVACTYDVKAMGGNEYLATQVLYVNGRTIQTLTQTYYDQSYAINNTNDPVEIGGFSDNPLTGTGSDRADRQTSAMAIDQISVYKKGLTAFEVLSHFKKVWTYTNFIKMQSPVWYTDFQDATVSDNGSVKFVNQKVGGTPAWILGDYIPNTDGPSAVPGASALYLSQTGMIYYQTAANGRLQVPTEFTDYTFEFFFRSSTARAGTLVSMQVFTTDFPGWLLEINKNKANENEVGTLCFTERRGISVQAPGGYNDDEWHHVVVRRWGSALDLFVDGYWWDRSTSSWSGFSSTSGPGQLFLFGGPTPTAFAGPGAIAHFAFYTYGLTSAQIEARTVFTSTFEIKGVVTLQGNPFSATVRFYDHRSGELIKEVESDSITGEYRATFGSAMDVDILCLDKYNPNVRYRAYGPITPSSYDDFPITI